MNRHYESGSGKEFVRMMDDINRRMKELATETKNTKDTLHSLNASIDLDKTMKDTMEGAEYKATGRAWMKKYMTVDPVSGQSTFDVNKVYKEEGIAGVKSKRDAFRNQAGFLRNAAIASLKKQGAEVTPASIQKTLELSGRKKEYDIMVTLANGIDKVGALLTENNKLTRDKQVVVVPVNGQTKPGGRGAKPNESYGPTSPVLESTTTGDG
jgi:hypothetical protein